MAWYWPILRPKRDPVMRFGIEFEVDESSLDKHERRGLLAILRQHDGDEQKQAEVLAELVQLRTVGVQVWVKGCVRLPDEKPRRKGGGK